MRALAVTAVLFVLWAGPAVAQANRCVECHFANFSHVPATSELADWDQSAHARHGVTCDGCHGGDPTTYQPVDAHRGVLNARHPLSSVNTRNLALTCAACHAGVVANFKVSAHAALGPDDRGPICTTCHGTMAARVPSPAQFEETCAGCHAGRSARDEYPGLARARVDAIRTIEQTLATVEGSIASIEDRRKRNRLMAELLLARAALRNATDAIHTFDFKLMDERRALAQRRASDLVAAMIASN